MSKEDLSALIIRVLSEMNALFLTTKSVSCRNVSRGSPLPSTVNSNGPTRIVSRPLPLDLDRARFKSSGRFRTAPEDFTATTQSPRRVSSWLVVISSVLECVERMAG